MQNPTTHFNDNNMKSHLHGRLECQKSKRKLSERASDPEVLIPTPTNGISSERAVRVEPRIRDRIMESSDIIPSSHGPTSTITLQRSASPLSPSVPGGQYVSPLTPPTSASFVPPQHFVPAVPQSYPPSIGYPTAGAGCPCAPPPPPPCCAPVQPCCMPSIPCCPPPPPVQCCPQPPVCCQPPPACCPPPVPVIPTCFRACPACPCRRRLHAALRMKRSPGTGKVCTADSARVAQQQGSSSCSSCKRSDSRSARVKRMGCLPCGKRKKRDIEEEYHRRVKRLGCLPCLGRKKRSPGCSPCGRKKRETKENNKSNPASCPCLSNHTRTFLLGRKKRAVDSEFDSMYTCDKSCCDYDRSVQERKLHVNMWTFAVLLARNKFYLNALLALSWSKSKLKDSRNRLKTESECGDTGALLAENRRH
ncbi:hypothetical protein NECAME_01645 [Necator americanus]|uniref:Uncharacterized protein n=1 Tax=Necator americanus TaxID=51031 RepID=W2TRW6_NECAM|nr:hypothetical protein NECAME_01645 [Necator americanus]ETN84419.1 hypothetical protein NECAME_01645 [Necator americanus]